MMDVGWCWLLLTAPSWLSLPHAAKNQVPARARASTMLMLHEVGEAAGVCVSILLLALHIAAAGKCRCNGPVDPLTGAAAVAQLPCTLTAGGWAVRLLQHLLPGRPALLQHGI